MKLITIKVSRNKEVMEVLKKEISKKKIKNAPIVSVIGAVDECCISNMSKKDAMKDILHTYKQPFELSGTGEIIDGKPHIHCVLGKEKDITLSGHLHWAIVKSWYITVYILVN